MAVGVIICKSITSELLFSFSAARFSGPSTLKTLLPAWMLSPALSQTKGIS